MTFLRLHSRRLFALLYFAAVATLLADETRPPSLTDIRENILEQRYKIQSLRVTYKNELTYDPALEKTGRLNGYLLHQEDDLATAGKKRYSKTISRGTDTSGSPLLSDRTVVYDGVDNRRRESKTLQIQKEKSAYSEINTFFGGLFWPYSDEDLEAAKKSLGTSYYFPFCLDDSTWDILPEPEIVNEVSCTVLRKKDGQRTVYLDPKRDWALIRITEVNPIEGVRRWTNNFSSLEEVLPGVFLPKDLSSTQEFVDPKTQEFIGNLYINCSVSRLDVNNVPDSLFVLEPQPGETVIDDIQRVIYKHEPTDDGSLDRAVNRVRAKMANQPFRKSGTRILLFVNSFLGTIVLAWVISRFTTRSTRENKS